MNCPACGSNLRDEARACLACGELIRRNVTPTDRLEAAPVGVPTWFAFEGRNPEETLYGAGRLARILAATRRRMPHRSATLRALDALPDDVTIATGIAMPDGRPISDVVIGPFGAAVVRELPPVAVTRVREGRWQLRTRRGWIVIESPLERAARDSERVRRWLAHDDADFIVKVYAAVVGPEPTIPRTTDCAVLTPDQLAPWIAGLPPQRSLTEGRRERLLEYVRDATR